MRHRNRPGGTTRYPNGLALPRVITVEATTAPWNQQQCHCSTATVRSALGARQKWRRVTASRTQGPERGSHRRHVPLGTTRTAGGLTLHLILELTIGSVDRCRKLRTET